MTARVFLVGGAVRDMLMDKEPKDFDFVVEGSSPEEMKSLGFKQVGADFPVFLHPETGDEWALCRTERKVGNGYNGFECDWQDVLIEDDLLRRDLTINSMAICMGEMGTLPTGAVIRAARRNQLPTKWIKDNIIDPWGKGQMDLESKTLRYTSEAFKEDPLRVLRVARFRARFGAEWTLSNSTRELIQEIFEEGELGHLTGERVWKETERALMEDSPHLFFETLEGLGIFPELDALRGVEQRADHHPEIDTFIHIMMCLEQAAKMNLSAVERFAVLTHDFGKRVTFDEHGNLHGHEEAGVPLVDTFCDRIKAPNEFRAIGKITSKEHTRVHRIEDVNPNKVMKLFELTDAIRKPERFDSFLKACEADARGRLGFEDREYPQADRARRLLKAALDVDTKSIAEEVTARHKRHAEEGTLKKGGNLGKKIAEAIRVERISQIRRVKL